MQFDLSAAEEGEHHPNNAVDYEGHRRANIIPTMPWITKDTEWSRLQHATSKREDNERKSQNSAQAPTGIEPVALPTQTEDHFLHS